MEPNHIAEIDAVDPDDRDEERLLRAWRMEQLERLGLPPRLAQTVADVVDWHDLAALVRRGCPPRLALEILR